MKKSKDSIESLKLELPKLKNMSPKEVRAFRDRVIAAHPKGKPMLGSTLIPDPYPVAAAIGFKKQPSMIDIMREQVREVVRATEREGYENFDDANDFDVPDDLFPASPHEYPEEAEVPLSVLRQRQADAQLDIEVEANKAKAAERAEKAAQDKPDADAEVQA